MRLHITFKTSSGADIPHIRHFDIDNTTYELLKVDFLRCLNEGPTALRGAAYTYVDVDTRQAKELTLRFDDILYMEAMPFQEQIEPASGKTPITGTLNTGSLLNRITSIAPTNPNDQ